MIFHYLGLPSGKKCRCGRSMKRYEWMNGKCDDCVSVEIKKAVFEKHELERRRLEQIQDRAARKILDARKRKGALT